MRIMRELVGGGWCAARCERVVSVRTARHGGHCARDDGAMLLNGTELFQKRLVRTRC